MLQLVHATLPAGPRQAFTCVLQVAPVCFRLQCPRRRPAAVWRERRHPTRLLQLSGQAGNLRLHAMKPPGAAPQHSALCNLACMWDTSAGMLDAGAALHASPGPALVLLQQRVEQRHALRSAHERRSRTCSFSSMPCWSLTLRSLNDSAPSSCSGGRQHTACNCRHAGWQRPMQDDQVVMAAAAGAQPQPPHLRNRASVLPLLQRHLLPIRVYLLLLCSKRRELLLQLQHVAAVIGQQRMLLLLLVAAAAALEQQRREGFGRAAEAAYALLQAPPAGRSCAAAAAPAVVWHVSCCAIHGCCLLLVPLLQQQLCVMHCTR